MPRGRKKKIVTVENVVGQVADDTKALSEKEKIQRPPYIPPCETASRRNEFGLIGGIEYKYTEDGFIDWKATIPQKHLFPNKEKFRLMKKDVPTDMSEVPEEDLLIKLSGLKWAARIRGYESVEYEHDFIAGDKCVSRCRIKWIPNYETDGRSICFEDSASATDSNCDGFARAFLESISANRAFARCVRNFLGINIVSEEEIGPYKEEAAAKAEGQPVNVADMISPQSIFLKEAEKSLGSLDSIVQFVNQSEVDTDGITSMDDLAKRIDPKTALKLLTNLRKSKNLPPKEG